MNIAAVSVSFLHADEKLTAFVEIEERVGVNVLTRAIAKMNLATAAVAFSSYFTYEKKRVKGIEPSCAAWEAAVLPLNYTRAEILDFRFSIGDCNRNKFVRSE